MPSIMDWFVVFRNSDFLSLDCFTCTPACGNTAKAVHSMVIVFRALVGRDADAATLSVILRNVNYRNEPFLGLRPKIRNTHSRCGDGGILVKGLTTSALVPMNLERSLQSLLGR